MNVPCLYFKLLVVGSVLWRLLITLSVMTFYNIHICIANSCLLVFLLTLVSFWLDDEHVSCPIFFALVVRFLRCVFLRSWLPYCCLPLGFLHILIGNMVLNMCQGIQAMLCVTLTPHSEYTACMLYPCTCLYTCLRRNVTHIVSHVVIFIN